MSTAMEIYNAGEKLKDGGQTEDAIAKFNEALEADDSLVIAHLALAVCHGKMGDHEKAVAHGEKACELDSSDPFNFAAMSVNVFSRRKRSVISSDFIRTKLVGMIDDIRRSVGLIESMLSVLILGFFFDAGKINRTPRKCARSMIDRT